MIPKTILPILFALSLNFTCRPQQDKITTQQFNQLMNNIALGWSTQNTDLALNSFDEDAIYMEPPNIQYYRGHQQLRPYFINYF